MTIERVVAGLLARLLPARVADEAAEDLLEDHRRVRTDRGVTVATIFLLRESLSLVASVAFAAVSRLGRSALFLRRDATHALRALTRRPWSSVAIILMLASGLAAVASASGLASTLLFRPISQTHPDRVRRLGASDRAGRTLLRFSEVELERVRVAVEGTAHLASVNIQPVVIRTGNSDTQTLAEVIGGRYFELVGLEVPLGRPLIDMDSAIGAAPVVVISDAAWRSRFDSNPSVLGTSVRLNGRAFTIVGVARSTGSDSFLGASVDAWIALAHADIVMNRNWRTNADDRFWTAIVSADPLAAAQVDAALTRASSDLAQQLPNPWRDRRLVTLPGTVMAGSQRAAAVTVSILLTAFAILILVAAAANVSGLLLASAAAERGRAAILLALGSGRATILRRHLTSGAVLGVASGLVALALYVWVRQQLMHVALLPTLSLRLELPFDSRVIAVTLAAGMTTGVLLVLGPALWMTRLDVAQTLRDASGRASSGERLSRARRVLVAAQVAISVVLLAGATLFARSVSTMSTLDVGFPRQDLIAMDFDVEPSAPSAAALSALAREALESASAVPGVVAAAMSNRAPIDSSTPTVSVSLPGSIGRSLDDVTFYLATARYFETLQLPIVSGRAFTDDESTNERDVAIVNRTLAERLWPDGQAVDRAMILQPQARTVRAVGVAQNSKYRSLSEAPQPHIYLPTAPAFGRALLVRTEANPRRAILAVQSALDRVGPGLVGFFPRTLDDHLAIDMLPARAAARAAAVLGLLALMLSAAGLYAIVTWFVEVRRREIGVRMALGASAGDVRWLVVRHAVIAAAPGLAIGLAAAIGLMAFGRSLFVGVGTVDLASLALASGALVSIVILASYSPSRRATRLDAVIALREM
jgi:putative ABC transport system permease protein